MANKILFDDAPTVATIIAADGAFVGLADDAMAVSDEVENGTALNTMASFLLYIQDWVAAPDAGGYFECHIVYQLDGTNYADGETGDLADPNLSAATLVGIFPLPAADEPMFMQLMGIPLQPFDFKVCIVNKSGQALVDGNPDTSFLKFYPYSLEVQ